MFIIIENNTYNIKAGPSDFTIVYDNKEYKEPIEEGLPIYIQARHLIQELTVEDIHIEEDYI